MKEKKTVFKLFFVWDFEKEERWLNEMAQEGWVLDNTGFSFYTFVRCEPGEFIIRLEMNPSSDYRAFVKELGAEYIGGCVNWAAGAGLFQYLAPDAAARKQLLCQLHRMGLLGLQHKAAGIKVFGKAGNAIGSCTHTAFLGGAALRDLLPRTGCKTHSSSSVFSARHPGAAPRVHTPERCSTPQACVQM